MRRVCETERKPACVLSATDQSTAWMRTKMRLPFPSPNQRTARGKSAIDGSGLNIAVNVSRRSVPSLLAAAKAGGRAAGTGPTGEPCSKKRIEDQDPRGVTPQATDGQI